MGEIEGRQMNPLVAPVRSTAAAPVSFARSAKREPRAVLTAVPGEVAKLEQYFKGKFAL
jgi:hypothetical protein